MDLTKIEEYARKNYPQTFTKESWVSVGGARGNTRKRVETELPVIVEEFDSHITIKPNKDASPIILSKNIL